MHTQCNTWVFRSQNAKLIHIFWILSYALCPTCMGDFIYDPHKFKTDFQFNCGVFMTLDLCGRSFKW